MVDQGGIHTRYYPLDALHVLPNNKVPKEKQKGQKVKEDVVAGSWKLILVLQPKPMRPQDRYDAMHQARKDINIENTFDNDAMLRYWNIVKPQSIKPLQIRNSDRSRAD